MEESTEVTQESSGDLGSGQEVETGQDNPESQNDSASPEPEKASAETPQGESILFETPDGRWVDAKTLTREWKDNFMPEFTKSKMRLKELEARDAGEIAKESAKDLGVDPTVAQTVREIVMPEVEKRLEQLKAEEQRKADDAQRVQVLRSQISKLASTWDGSDGKPKFDPNKDTNKLYALMAEKQIYDPVAAWEYQNRSEIFDWMKKQELRSKSGVAPTEKTGTQGAQAPQAGDAPKSIREAGQRAASRVASS